jgi:type IV secretory pathway TraG/TraD family ATPase VirD4
LPEDDKTLTQQLLLINDEFTAPGALEVIKKSIAYIRGYNLRLMTIIQAPSQLRDPAFYGKEGAETLIQNHALKVIYPPSDDSIAEEYSKLLGHYTLRERNSSANRSGKGIGEINQNVSYGESYSSQKRPLMYPQELKLLGKDQQIVVVSGEGVYPALTQKAFYYKSPIFLGRLAQSSTEFKRFLAKITQPSKSELDSFRVRGEFEAVIHHKQHVNLQPQELLNTITNEPTNVLAIDEGRLMSALEESIPDVGDMPSIDAWLAAVELEMSSAIKSAIKSPSEATS